VAIVGAGLAGLTCAQALDEQGWNPTLFDKGRRPGGRLATRESRHHALRFNHGAQDFEAQDRRFRERLTQWTESEWVAPAAQAGLWSLGPRAATLPEALADGLAIHCRTRIVRLHREAAQWWLEAESGQRFGPFDALVLTLPPAQLAELIAASALPELESLAQSAAEAMAEGAWAFMLALEGEPKAFNECAWPGTLRISEPDKEGKRALTALLPESMEGVSLEETPEALIAAWAPRLTEALGQPVAADAITTHRWRYARFSAPAPCATWHPALGLALAGDGYGLEDTTADGVEAAYLGGRAAAGRLMAWALAGSLAPSTPVSPRAQANQGSLF
jgi:predicted NAD/FAD-dependent oxidoreductase